MKKIETEVPATSGEKLLVPVNQVRESPDNGRINYDEAALKDLMQSIKSTRLEEDVVVRRVEADVYEVVDGHRRFRAVQRLGWDAVPVLVKPLTEEEARLYRVATIFQRANATPYEEARYLAAALKNPGMTRQLLSQTCGIKPGTLRNRLELLEFPEQVAKRVGVDGFAAEHARILASLAAYPDALAVGLKVAEDKDTEGTMRSAPRFFEDVKKALVKANAARDPTSNRLWEVRNAFPTFEGQAGKLACVKHKTQFGEAVLVLDVAAFDGLVDKAKATLERRKEKDAKPKEDADEARRIRRRERQLEVEHAANEWKRDALREAAFSRLGNIKEVEASDLASPLLDALEVGIDENDIEPLAEAAGVPVERLRGFLAWNNEGEAASQDLIQHSTPIELLRLVLALSVARSLDGQSGTWSTLCGHWTGKTMAAWDDAATEAARGIVKAKGKQGEAEEAEATA
ncbi:MAG: ParB/RepB/Spo0J family partition protein [bacterium]